MTRRLALVVALALLGMALCAVGLFLIYPPMALIAAGVALVWLAFVMEV